MVPYFASGAWFVVQVAAQHEKRVASLLESKGYKSFSPVYLSRRRWSDRIKVVEQPLFPGYVFFRSKESAAGLVRSTPGVLRVVAFGGKPARVPDDEIDAVSRVLKVGLDASPFAPWLKIGQTVEVHRGPLRGITGRLVTIKNSARLVLSIEVTMQSISVEIDIADVKVIAQSAQLPTVSRGGLRMVGYR